MTYNPVLQKWEGNDAMMQEFEKHFTKQNRPALISNLTGYKTVQKVGDMIFDPVKMCWIGNEEDVMIFGDEEQGLGALILVEGKFSTRFY